MIKYVGLVSITLSLPLWERGLKYHLSRNNRKDYKVAPLVGAWIEILWLYVLRFNEKSLPLWERGLKLYSGDRPEWTGGVAPLVGAWIEIV